MAPTLIAIVVTVTLGLMFIRLRKKGVHPLGLEPLSMKDVNDILVRQATSKREPDWFAEGMDI